MFPGVDGFRWDTGHVVFLGAFFTVAVTAAATLVAAFFRSMRDRQPEQEQRIRWRLDFSELPARDRCCRHEMTGEVARRQCPNEFDCRRCPDHPAFVRLRPGPMAEVEEQAVVCGMALPLDRLYHRGHTWARRESDGAYTVGLDEFARRLFGRTNSTALPGPGDRAFVNGVAWTIGKDGDAIRVLSPVEGEVIAAQSENPGGWTLKVKPAPHFRDDHLLRGAEVAAWMTREIERLELSLGSRSALPALADGGALVQDLSAECPDVDWSDVRARMLLNA
jgi:glycine cleavage system H lipoate-binding protein